MNIRKTLVFVFIFLSNSLYATVGGPQYIRILGLQGSDLLMIYEYHDARANPPELWRYAVNEDSLYIDSDWINYPHESIEEALERMDLKNLPQPDTLLNPGNLSFEFLSPINTYMESMDLYYDLYPVKIKWQSNEYTIYQCHQKEPRPEVIGSYTLMKKADTTLQMTLVRYKGVCFEAGYLKDTILVQRIINQKVTEKPAESEQQIQEDNDDNKVQYLVAVLVLISVILLVYVVIRSKRRRR